MALFTAIGAVVGGSALAGAAVVGATAAVVGTAASISAQKKAARAQQQQQDLQVRRSQRAAIREAQLRRAQTQATALGMGVVGGSALAGGVSSLSSQVGEAMGFGSQMSGLSKQISIASTRAQTASAIAGLGAQTFSSLGGFSTMFPNAQGTGAPSAEALLRGIG